MIRDGTSKGYMGVYLTESVDNGINWSADDEITDQVKLKSWRWYAFGPGGAIVLKQNKEYEGRIIIPANHSVNRGNGNNFLGSHVVYSDDNGKNWQIGAVDSEGSGSVNPNELAVVELFTGLLYFNTRNQNYHPDTLSNRAINYSQDGGITFIKKFFHEPQLVTPVVHASLCRIGNTIVFIAPHHREERKDLSLWISKDGASTWDRPILLHKGFSAYSSTVALDRNRVGILFENGRARNYEIILFKSIRMTGIQ
jgi:sialidase-1